MWFGREPTLPDATDALPGRATAMPVAAAHFVNGHPLTPPFPDGLESAVFGLGCFWGAERKFWQTPGVWTHRRRLRRRLHAEPDLRGGLLAAAPATPRPCSWCSTRRSSATSSCCKVFWEGHDPTQGMRQGNDVGTQYRSAIYTYRRDAAARPPRRRRDAFQQRADRRRLRRHHHRDRRRAGAFYYAEDYHQQYLAKNPNGYCGLGGTGHVVPDRRGAASSEAGFGLTGGHP